MKKKYKLLKDDTVSLYWRTLYRIKALRNFLNRRASGFEIKKNFYKDAETKVLRRVQKYLFV